MATFHLMPTFMASDVRSERTIDTIRKFGTIAIIGKVYQTV